MESLPFKICNNTFVYSLFSERFKPVQGTIERTAHSSISNISRTCFKAIDSLFFGEDFYQNVIQDNRRKDVIKCKYGKEKYMKWKRINEYEILDFIEMHDCISGFHE